MGPVCGPRDTGRRSSLTLATLRDRVLEFLLWDEVPKTVEEISENVGAEIPMVRSAISLLGEDGLIEGRSGDRIAAVRQG